MKQTLVIDDITYKVIYVSDRVVVMEIVEEAQQ